MKEYTTGGWIETTKEVFEAKMKTRNNFMLAGKWVEFSEKYKAHKQTGGKIGCQRCGAKWSEFPPESPTFLVVMKKQGNHIVCEKCNNEIDCPTINNQQ